MTYDLSKGHSRTMRVAGDFLAALKANRGVWIMDGYGVRLRGGWGNPVSNSDYEMDRVQRALPLAYTVFRQKPFIDRNIK